MRTTTYQELQDAADFQHLVCVPIPKFMHATVLILTLLIAVSVTWLAYTNASLVILANGRVRAIAGENHGWEELTTHVASETGGQVEEVYVDAGLTVRKGDLLLRFNTERLANQLAQLEQKLMSNESQLSQLQYFQSLQSEKTDQDLARAEAELKNAEVDNVTAIAKRESELRSALAELADAQDQHVRITRLQTQQAASERELNQARTALAKATEMVAQAALPVFNQRVDVLRKSLEAVVRDARVKHQETQILINNKQGESRFTRIEIEEVRLRIGRSTVSSPNDGVVTEVTVKAGDVVQGGKVGISTVRKDSLALVADVSSSDVGRLQTGMPVRIKLDAFDFREYGVAAGTVQFISPDSRLIEGPNRKQSAVYQVTIQLATEQVERGANCGRIKLGMTGISEIVTDQHSLLMLLIRTIKGTISLT